MTTLEFHRPVRNHPAPLEPSVVAIAAPPPLPPKAGGAAWQVVVPLIGSLGSVVFIVYARISPLTIILTGVMLLASVGGSVLVRAQQAHVQKQRVQASRAKYVEYLADLRRSLNRYAQAQRQIAETLYPAPEVLLARTGSRDQLPERLWERRWTDDDFLDARVGLGYVPLYRTITMPEHSVTALDIDTEMDEAARTLQSDFQVLPDMPLVVSLKRAGSVAICGAPAERRGVARSILVSLAFNHAPSDLRILLYAPPGAMERWAWLKWLPHTRALRHTENIAATEPERLCMMAETVDDFKTLLDQQVEPEFARRSHAQDERRDNAVPVAPPHFLIVIDDYAPYSSVARLSTLTRILERVTTDANRPESQGVRITVLTLTDTRDSAPSVLYGRFELQGSGVMRYQETRQGGRPIEAIRPDPITESQCEDIARALSPITIGSSGAEVDLSREVRLLSLLGFPSVDAIESRRLWQPRTPESMMVVPVGIGEDGVPVELNLREPAEKGIGPHGMLIGQPGMGKTEFLRTLVLGLAMTHSPEEVTFVFIDYKGDTAFRDLATLPHCVGLVTRVEQDSSGDLVGRLHQSLQGERARRAAMLGAVNADKISEYHALRRIRPDLPPLPYLIIIIDEYAALLHEHQELKDFFTQIGQQGRSPGMNMLLASQSPSGGNLQSLESYLSYHISVRTLSPADSTAALGTPDAYYLPNFIPGLAYLKAGEHYYRKFRTALATAPYESGAPSAERNSQVREFNIVGALVPLQVGKQQEQRNGAATAAGASGEPPPTELAVTAERLRAAAEERNWATPHQVWVPPLPRMVTLGQLAAAAQVDLLGPEGWPGAGPSALRRVPLGLVDHVREQRQVPYLYDFTGQAGHLVIIGVPKTGASTLLKTILAALLATTTPLDTQFYLIDAGGGRLDCFAQAPHVGAVCGGSEAEVVRRMVSQVRGMLRRREERFRRERIGGIGVFRELRATLPPDGDDVGADIFLVIDNVNALRTEAGSAGYEGDLISDLAAIAGTGLTYGIHLILTAQSNPPAAVVGNVLGRIELRLSDPHTSTMGKTADGTVVASLVAHDIPGRGVISGPYLFQAALPILDADTQSIETLAAKPSPEIEQQCERAVAALVGQAHQRWTGTSAPAVRLLPRMLTEGELRDAEARPGTGFVLGLEEATLQPLCLDLTSNGPHLVVYGDIQHGKTSLLRMLIAQLAKLYSPEDARFVLIDPHRGLLDCTESPLLLRSGDQFGYACTKEMLEDCVALLKQQLDPRKPSAGRMTLDELRAGKRWSGPQIFVFYDDFEPGGLLGPSPLTPLSELVQQSTDIGLHVIVSRQLADPNRGMDQVFERIRGGGSPLLILGSDTQGLVPGGQARGKALPPGRAFLVRQRESLTLLQVMFHPRAMRA